MAKVLINYQKGTEKWFDKKPEGTQEELEEAFEVANNYLYKMLDYAEKEEHIPDDELARERRIFSFAKQGPRAHYFLLDKSSKLVSADVLYILTSTLPAEHIAKRFNMSGRKVRAIRRGEEKEWYFEYLLVRRLKAIIKAKIKDNALRSGQSLSYIYTVSKLNDKNMYEVQAHLGAYRNAIKYRKDIMTEKKYNKMVEDKTLDIIYPIAKVDLL